MFDFDSSSVVDLLVVFFGSFILLDLYFLFGQTNIVSSQTICARGIFVESSC